MQSSILTTFPSLRNIRVPATLGQAPIASPIGTNGTPAAETNVLSAHHCWWRSVRSDWRSIRASIAAVLASSHWLRWWANHAHGPRHSTWQSHAAIRVATLKAPGRFATAATTRAIAGADFTPGHRTATAASRRSAFANGYRQALHYATAARTLARVHAIVGAEVAADHERLGGCAVTSKGGRFVWHICAVLAVVDADFAEVAKPGLIGLVKGRRPVSAFAKTYSGIVG
jgi:hypothetical protein